MDAFQGSEADVVIISAVRAGTSADVGFVADERRLNVALTRARHVLIFVCHAGHAPGGDAPLDGRRARRDGPRARADGGRGRARGCG